MYVSIVIMSFPRFRFQGLAMGAMVIWTMYTTVRYMEGILDITAALVLSIEDIMDVYVALEI